jgi:hypothetical protein
MSPADRDAEMLFFSGQCDLHLFRPRLWRGGDARGELLGDHGRSLRAGGGDSRMQMTKRSLVAVLLLSLGATAGAPDRADAAPMAPAPTGSPRPRAPHPVSPEGADQTPEVPVPPGAWAESKLYKFRLEKIAACGEGPPGRLKGETSWVGAFLTVVAKEPEVYVTARDLELRRGGVTLSATFAGPPALPGCKPLLAARRLRPGEAISGFAVFEVPRSFRAKTEDPIVISYRPTRWGGARRAEVPIPECFDACSRPWITGESKAAARTPSPPARKL